MWQAKASTGRLNEGKHYVNRFFHYTWRMLKRMVIFATKTKKHIKDMIEQGETKETFETTKTAKTQTDNASKETQQDERFMRAALAEAQAAYDEGEIPVGAVIVAGGRIIARAHNLTETLCDVTAHAEMQAITMAAAALGGKYLKDCTLYVTVEPCIMCAGAIGWAQLSRIVYGAEDIKRGYALYAPKAFHPKATVTTGVLEEECRQLMQQFFKDRR